MIARRYRLSAVALMLIVSTTLAACGSTAATPAPASSSAPGAAATVVNAVTISNFAFSPATITVPVGTTVTWTNKDSASHTVTADDGKAFDSKGIAQGATFTFTFATAGTYAYHCAVHPDMKATVIVTP